MNFIIKRPTNQDVKCWERLKDKATQKQMNDLAKVMIKCADKIRAKIETPSLKLHADFIADTVNGSITITHGDNEHAIRVEIYESDKLPDEIDTAEFKRPSVMPTRTELEQLL